MGFDGGQGQQQAEGSTTWPLLGDFRVRSVSGVPVVSAPSDLDCSNVNQLCGLLLAAAADAMIVVVDMTATTFCSGSSLGRLVRAKAWLEESLVELRLAGCTERVRKVMAITGDDRVLPIFASPAEAVTMKPRDCWPGQAA
jgi:anti-anti-sigma factor